MRRICMKFTGAFLLLTGLLLICKADCCAQTYYTNSDTGYRVEIEDDAGLLTSEEISQLASSMEDITEYGNVAFKSVSYNASSASSFAKSHYRNLFGQKSGTLFLIDMDNREIYIFSDGRVYRAINKSYALSITDNVYRYASAEQYFKCADSAFSQMFTLLEGGRILQPMKYINNALLAMILSLLFTFAWVCIYSGQNKPTDAQLMKKIHKSLSLTPPVAVCTHKTKTYSPQSSDSGGSGGSSGGGGGSSGGGGGHSF